MEQSVDSSYGDRLCRGSNLAQVYVASRANARAVTRLLINSGIHAVCSLMPEGAVIEFARNVKGLWEVQVAKSDVREARRIIGVFRNSCG